VDQVLFELLEASDNDELPLAWRLEDGSFVSLTDFGSAEMAGWLVGSRGWRSAFSTQRYFNPFRDLNLAPEDDPSDPG
jgi:hypothetical protein